MQPDQASNSTNQNSTHQNQTSPTDLTFYQKLELRLREITSQLTAEIPELQGVCVAILWDPAVDVRQIPAGYLLGRNVTGPQASLRAVEQLSRTASQLCDRIVDHVRQADHVLTAANEQLVKQLQQTSKNV